MLQNKIYQNFLLEIFKSFTLILFALSLVALTIRAVSFLDLIVENGYPITTYFMYSFYNLFGITPKFIPLAFVLSLSIFIIKHKSDSEFIILWTSGVKKMQIVNLLLLISIIIMIFYLLLSIIITPLALNKSRQLLSKENYNSFLPTIRTKQFSDSFKGFTFFVDKKINNEIKNIFLHDKGNNISNLLSNAANTTTTTIVSENGIIDEKKMLLLNGQIITTKDNSDNEIIKFEQLNINLDNLSTATIKKPKIQETSTFKLIDCFFENIYENSESTYCNSNFKKESLSTLNRRIIIPFYIPIIALISGLLLIKSKKFYFNKISIFIYSFSLLLFIELAVRYTGLKNILFLAFVALPFIFSFILYTTLIYKFSKET
jgi:lipopolysaccharide export LptBFGC system permease protein LptF